MRATVWLIVVFLAATIFTVSNNDPVTVKLFRWPLYTGPLSLALIGVGLAGALITFVVSLALQAGLRERIHELEQTAKTQQEKLASLPTWAQPRPSPGPPSGPPEDPPRFP
jgi:uncharacterized integral membrane protein